MERVCRCLIIVLTGLILVAGCATREQHFITYDSAPLADAGVDALAGEGGMTSLCQPELDEDQDTIPNEIEGCFTDTDDDGFPDYQDTDSDNDRILDHLEVGPDAHHPLDSDGDQIPDYQDTDSDDDGVMDQDEDRNGDGLLGCCLAQCDEVHQGCPPPVVTGCGPGQECLAGQCLPAAHFLCADGETDPKQQTTFAGQQLDSELPTFICRHPDELSQQGLKRIKFVKSTVGQWHLALEDTSTYGEATMAAAKPLEAAATFDLLDYTQAVAGFVVSQPTAAADVAQAASEIIATLSTQLSGIAEVHVQVSGTVWTSHDGFPTVVSSRLAITLNAAKNPPAVRNEIISLLLGRDPVHVASLPPANFGPSSNKLLILFQTLLRPQEGQLLIMGGVAEEAMVKNPALNTGFHLNDLANGTGLATLSDDGEQVECDPFVRSALPRADIIWVVDESESMDDNRQDIVQQANDFFALAQKSGLDFRMGVTSMVPPGSGVTLGKLCSEKSSDKEHDGGVDQFLLPSQQAIFEACIENPPYYSEGQEYGLAAASEAVTQHLPRAPSSNNDLTRIRLEAKLVIIIVTDEAPSEMKLFNSWKGKPGFLAEDLFAGTSDYQIDRCTSPKQNLIDDFVKDWIDLLSGQDPAVGPEASAIVHLIGGICKHPCGFYPPEYPWGYQELVQHTGGQMADICQQDLGTTLQLIIDSIAGASSPMTLQYIPISASLAVAINQTQIPRNRAQGFDYSASSNGLVLINIPFQPGDQVMVSYRRWTKQNIFID